jgi:glycosyltransferase involved in cell wall biosynthesis
MDIGYLISKYPYHNKTNVVNYDFGGSTISAYELAQKMALNGHDINIFTTSYNSKFELEKQNYTKIYRFGTNLRLGSTNISFGLFRKIINYDVDVFHAHFDIPPGPFAALNYKRKKDSPLVITYHGDWLSDYGSIFRRAGVYLTNKLMVNKLLSSADVIISPSEYYVEQSDILKQHVDKIRVIHNGINTESFEIKETCEDCRQKLGIDLNINVILYVGYLVNHKGPEILLDSFKEILDHSPDTLLIFVGDGTLKKELEKKSQKEGYEMNIRFTGFLDQDLIKMYYKSADLLILPSLSDCFPMVILEAMASGLPIIASDIGGISEMVTDNQNGILIEPGNDKVISDTALHLLSDGNILKKMGEKGKSSVLKFTWENIYKETEDLYRELLAAR